MANVQKIVVKQTGAEKSANSIKKVDKSITGLTTSALKYTAAAGVVLAVVKKTVDIFGRQEQAEKKLATALGKTSTELLRQADAMQQLTTFGDEAIIEQQAFLAALNFTEKQITQMLPAILDLASATGMDLNSATKNVAKTFSGMQGELGELIPQLKTLTKEELQAGGAIQLLTDLFGGQAAAAADTMTGSLQQAGSAVGDAAEVVGKALSPAIIVLADSVKRGTELLFGMNTEIDKLIVKSKDSARWTWERAKANKAMVEQWKELEAQAKILAPLDEKMRDIGIDTTIQLEKQIPLYKEQADIINDLSYNFDAAINAADGFSEAMVSAIIHGQDLKAAASSAAKALAVDLVSGFIRAKLISSTTLAATVAESIAGAKAIAAAWATPAALAATATAGASAVTGGAALTATVALSKGLAAFAQGADFITNGPQLMLVGDNSSGKEHVQVTPMGGDPNINGPQGGNTFIFNGDILGTDDFVETKLIPSINRAVNQGRANLA